MHCNKINGKVYIGLTKNSPSKRFGYKGKRYEDCTLFQRAIEKYGWDNFSHQVLASGLTKDEACKLETVLIEWFCAQDSACGYNILAGGESSPMPEDVRKKISEAHKGKKHSPEAIAKSAAHRTGLKRSPETCKRISEAKKGYPKPPNSGVPAKPVQCVETGQIFDSASAASRILKINRSHIRDACLDPNKTHCGYHWRFC